MPAAAACVPGGRKGKTRQRRAKPSCGDRPQSDCFGGTLKSCRQSRRGGGSDRQRERGVRRLPTRPVSAGLRGEDRELFDAGMKNGILQRSVFRIKSPRRREPPSMDFLNWLASVFWTALKPSIDTTQVVIFIAIIAVETARILVAPKFKPTLTAVGTRLTTSRVALGILVAVISTRLLLAPYWVWQNEHRSRLTAECKIEQLSADRERRRTYINRNLGEFYAGTRDLIQTKITLSDMPSFTAKVTNFENTVILWVNDNMGRAAVEKLKDMTSHNVYSGGVNDAHNDILFGLHKLSENILTLEQPEWDAMAPQESTKECE